MSTTEAPEGRYRIAEAAELSGFSATTLRFYEHEGVLAPAAAGLLTASGVALFGVAGLVMAIPVALWFRHRRDIRRSCTPPDGVPVELMERPANIASDRTGTGDGEAVTTR